MKERRLALYLLCALALTLRPVIAPYVESRERFCTNDYYSKIIISDEDRTTKRASSQIPLTFPMDKLVAFVGSPAQFAGLLGGGGAVLIAGVVLLVAAILTSGALIAFCCCLKVSKSPNPAHTKWFCVAAFVLWGVFVCVLIAVIVYANVIYSSLDFVNCGIASVPFDTLQGVNRDRLQFIGFKNLETFFNDYLEEVGYLNSKTNNFDAITSKNLAEGTTSLKLALKNFYTNYKDKTTNDSTGSTAKPATIKSLEVSKEFVSPGIEAEFNLYNGIIEKLNEAAKRGKALGNSGTLAATKNNVKILKTLVGDLASNLASSADKIVDSFASGTSYAMTLEITIVVLGFAMFGAMGFALLIHMCMYAKGRCLSCRKITKALMIVTALILIIFSMLATLFLAISIGSGTICQFLSNILSDSKVETYITADTFGDKITTLLTNCIPTEKKGDLLNIFTEKSVQDTYNETVWLFDGMTSYENIRTNLDSTTNIVSVEELTTWWGKYRSGLFYDHANVTVTLAALNKLISCGKISYTLNVNNCTTTSGVSCIDFNTVKTFNAPDCTDDLDQSKKLFNNLKLYTDETKLLLTEMNNAMISTDTGNPSPNLLFKTIRTNLKSINLDYLGARSAIPSSMGDATRIKTNFGTAVNCQILRKEAENLETVLCFTINQPMFMFSVLVTASVVLILIGLWLMCISLRNFKPPSNGDEDGGEAAMSMNDTQLTNMENDAGRKSLK
jgi:hypothetical protein